MAALAKCNFKSLCTIVLLLILTSTSCLIVQAFHPHYSRNSNNILQLNREIKSNAFENKNENKYGNVVMHTRVSSVQIQSHQPASTYQEQMPVNDNTYKGYTKAICAGVRRKFNIFKGNSDRKEAFRISMKMNSNSNGSSDSHSDNEKTLIIRKQLGNIAFTSLMSIFMGLKKTIAAGAGTNVDAANARFTPIQGCMVWFFLFVLSATLHSAESAITKISPYKVQEFADEEGAGSPFATLSSNLTRLLSTILLTTTACSIYSTALFVTTASQIFPTASLGFITAVLTVVTLFFGEILPKALAVANSELVTRKMVPPISKVAALLTPVTTTINVLSNFVLALFGLRNKEDENVSEDMLRMVVADAQRTAGIDTNEGRMIKAVLDMDSREVQKIMRPRVDIVALPLDATGTQMLQTAMETKYSRIPVYEENIDNIVGVLLTKDLLDYLELPSEHEQIQLFRPKMKESWTSLDANVLMESTFFVPEKMSTWDALQAMRKRRVHMAIVVDEYGGTSGLVSFEDILEEVVGEIYDEDDDEEEDEDLRMIYGGDDGTINIKGSAELADVYDALGLKDEQFEEELEKYLEEYSTIGGLVTSLVGEIPQSGSVVTFGGYSFNITEVDDRRVILVNAERMSNNMINDDDDNNDGKDSREGSGISNENNNNNNNNNSNNNKDLKNNGSSKLADVDKNGNTRSYGLSSPQDINNSNNGNTNDEDGNDEATEDYKKKSFRDGEWVDMEVDDDRI